MKFRKLCLISVMFFVCGFFGFVHAGPPNYFKTFKEIEDFLSHSEYDLNHSKELLGLVKQKGLNFEECCNLYVEDFQNTRKGSCRNIATWVKSKLDKANIPNILVGCESESDCHVANVYIGADGSFNIFDGAIFVQHRKDKKKPLYRTSFKKYVETYGLSNLCVFDKEFSKQIIPNISDCIGTDMIAYCLREKAQKQIDFLSKGKAAIPKNFGSLSNWAFLPNIGSEEQRSELVILTGILHSNFNSNPSDTQDDLVNLIFSKLHSFSVV